jgi:uncharacterized protein YjbI with pentapeptide repeats
VLFELVNPFSLEVSFTSCNLSHASFYKLSIKRARFIQCELQEVDFTEADLTESNFQGADLHGAIFENSNLEKADFSSARHFQIDPRNNKVKKAKFTLDGLPGLLTQFQLEIK